MLTIDSDSGFHLFGIFTAGDAACVETSVWTLELWDGQNIVEQHVRLVFQDPLGSRAAVAILKVDTDEELTLKSRLCVTRHHRADTVLIHSAAQNNWRFPACMACF